MDKKINALRKEGLYRITPANRSEFASSSLKEEGDELLTIDTYNCRWFVLRGGVIVTIQYQEASSTKLRDIAHYRAHGKRNVVLESELEKMKTWGLYQEGDELLTADHYLGDFIVLRKGDVHRIKFGHGSKDAEFKEECWMEKARGR